VIARADLPPSLLAELKHLASLHNPLFYREGVDGSSPSEGFAKAPHGGAFSL